LPFSEIENQKNNQKLGYVDAGPNIAPVKVAQTLERNRDRIAQSLTSTYLGLISKSLHDISESQGIQSDSRTPCHSLKSTSEK